MIYFFGSDGTGKTTHADLIAAYLRLRGFRVWRASIKHHHTLAYLLMKLMNLISGYDIRIINYYGFPKELANKVNRVWKIIEFFSLLPAIFYRVYLPMLLGYIVVCDRYILDSLVTLSFFLKEQKFILGLFARILVRLMPRNSFLVFFDADADTIMLRKQDEPLNANLITHYRWAYSILLKIYGLKAEKINTTNVSIRDVQGKITSLIERVLSI